MVVFCGFFEFVTVFAVEFLIGGDNGFPRIERGKHVGFCGFNPAYRLYNYIHFGIGANFRNVGGDSALLYAEGQGTLPLDFEHAFDNDVYAVVADIFLPVFGKYFIGAAAHVQFKL